MICESQLISIISMDCRQLNFKELPRLTKLTKLPNLTISKITSFENVFSYFFNKSKLKSKLKHIYYKTNIPIDSFYIGIYYLNKYFHNKYFQNINNYSIEDINNYVITSILLANKQLLDTFNVKNFCYLINFNFDLFCIIEIDILNTINWDTYYDTCEYLKFKSLLEHYMD